MNRKLANNTKVIFFIAIVLLPVFSIAPAFAQTAYSVIIESYLDNNAASNAHISMDGVDTGYLSPHTFSGLTGTHNFTVGFNDLQGHIFLLWNNRENPIPKSTRIFSTFTVNEQNVSSSAYCAYYDAAFNGTAFSWPENRYYVTPNDPAVIAAAGNMTWNEILDWVATNIVYNSSLDYYQFPNETLACHSGVCREYSGLAVSMLEARGYTAYVVPGNTTGHLDINHAWVAVELNGTLYHFEPQATLDNQPEPLSWAQQRTAWYFYNDKVFVPATTTYDLPPPAPDGTYKVTIIAKGSTDKLFLGTQYDVNVPIFLDGKDTGHLTPYTFTGLKGTHAFAVGYKDSKGNLFYAWDTNAPSNRWFQSIAISQEGTYYALFSPNIDITQPSPAQWQYFITPQDTAVAAAAKGKNWTQIVDYVSSLPRIRPHVSSDPVLFPNQTLNGGYFLPDYTLLCCSMLLANGYTAYYAGKTEDLWSAWVVLDINGTLTPISPYRPLAEETVAWIEANYFASQTGVDWATVKENPNTFIPTPTPTPGTQPSSTPSASPTPNPTQNSTPNPVTPSPTPTNQPPTTTEPSATIPEIPVATVLMVLFPVTALILISNRKIRKDRNKPVIV